MGMSIEKPRTIEVAIASHGATMKPTSLRFDNCARTVNHRFRMWHLFFDAYHTSLSTPFCKTQTSVAELSNKRTYDSQQRKNSFDFDEENVSFVTYVTSNQKSYSQQLTTR